MRVLKSVPFDLGERSLIKRASVVSPSSQTAKNNADIPLVPIMPESGTESHS
ncbi:MAG TPA: hypothetical protein V6C90_06725 [Coleofasciculaceae cyanobacterium]